MAQQLDIKPSIPWFEITTPLDDGRGTTQTFTFEFKWNVRDSCWYFHVYDQNRSVIASSVRVALGMYLGRRSTHAFFRDCVIVAIDTSRQGKEPTLDDLGTRVTIVRFTAQEVVTGRAVRGASGLPTPANPMPWWTES